MSSQKERCPSCFRISGSEVCPHCGYEGTEERNPLVLDLGFELNGRYHIGRVLGKPGGFGITYLAFDERLQTRVAVKEYLPREIAARGSDGASVRLYSADEEGTFEYGLDRFLGEARALAQFDHANIVGVQDFFEANGTAYLAMDYYEGKTLKQYLAEQPEGRMDPENATEIMLRVLDGLKEVHAEDYLHRDVKPSNIYLTAEGRPILIDFGAARLALGERSRSLSVVMTEGYAPYEQYSREGNQGPHTDVYGCGATLYRMVTGQKPPPATDRVIEDRLEAPSTMNPAVPEGLSRAITDALAMGDAARISTSAELQDRLRAGLQDESAGPGSSEEQAAETPPRAETEPGSDGAGRGRTDREGASPADEGERSGGIGWGTVAVGVLLVAALGLGGVAVALYPSGEGGADQDTEQTASAGPSSGPEQSSSSESSSSSTDQSRTEQLLEEARGHLEAGRLTSPEATNALSAVRQALEQSPGNEEAQRLLGRIADQLAEKGTAARQEDNLQAALNFYKRSLEIESQPEVQDKLETVRSRMQTQEKYERLLGEVRSTLNQEDPSANELEEAVGAARDAEELRPEGREAERLLGRIADRLADRGTAAREEGNLQASVGFFEQSLEIKSLPDVQDKLEAVRSQMERQRNVRQLLGRIRSTIDQESPSIDALRGAINAARDVKDLRPFSERMKQNFERVAARAAELGEEARESLSYPKAIRYFEISLKLQDDAAIRESLQTTWEQRLKALKGKPQRVLQAYRRQIERNPENATYRYNYGSLLLKSDRYDAAAEQLKKAVELDPDDPRKQYNLGAAYLNKGVVLQNRLVSVRDSILAKNRNPTEEEVRRMKGLDQQRLQLFQNAIPPLEQARQLSGAGGQYRQSACSALLQAYVQTEQKEKAQEVEDCAE